MAHTDANLARVPRAVGITAVDLRTVSVPADYEDRLAETKFLLAPQARETTADYVGLCSVNYDRKWPDPPHLADLPRLARHLGPSLALGEGLIGLDEWMASAEWHHPGLAAVLERVAETFDLELHNVPVPGANTFICHREHYLWMLDRFSAMMEAVFDWYGTEIPFRYRCPDCGTSSDSGYGRWTDSRHVGYVGERLTRLIFATRPDISFWTPAAFERSSRRRWVRGRARRKVNELLQPTRHEACAGRQPWHRSTEGLGETAESSFSACPVCANNDEHSTPIAAMRQDGARKPLSTP
jgi:hypothetical protein